MDQGTAEEAQRKCARAAVDLETAVMTLNLADPGPHSLAADWPGRLIEAQTRVAPVQSTMGGSADLDLLYAICRACRAVRVLETGVAFGWSSLAILSAIAPRAGAKLVSVDMPYPGANLDDLVGIAVPHELHQYWFLYRGADRDFLPKAIDLIRPIDLAHYDSDKSYRGRQWAYPMIWNALRPAGLLISDDVHNNSAFFDFALDIGASPVIVARTSDDTKFSGILKKGP